MPEELLVKLRDLDVFGLTVPKQYGGLDLMNTEILRLYEVLGRPEIYLFCNRPQPFRVVETDEGVGLYVLRGWSVDKSHLKSLVPDSLLCIGSGSNFSVGIECFRFRIINYFKIIFFLFKTCTVLCTYICFS